jgi:hypothetical protein
MLQSTGFFAAFSGGDGLSRYHTDFHEIQVSIQIPKALDLFRSLHFISCTYV